MCICSKSRLSTRWKYVVVGDEGILQLNDKVEDNGMPWTGRVW